MTIEKPGLSRRTFVRASAIGAAAVATTQAIPGAAAAAAETTGTAADATAATAPYVGAGSNAPVRPFWLHEVKLGTGLLQEKRDRMKAFLQAYDERRFLVLFNQQAGRPNPAGVSNPGGWENGGLLSGHWAGHYMSALAQAYADQGEQVFKTKLDWMVTELAACQAAITARMTAEPEEPEEPEEPVIGRVPGRFGNGLRLNGGSAAEHVRLPQEAVSQLTDFTIATWVNLASTTSWSRIFDFGTGTTVNMFLTARASGGLPRFAITTSGGSGEQLINGTSQIPTGQWVHMAVTLNGTVGTLYVNGAVSGTNTNITLNPTNLGAPGNVWIGRSQYGDPMLNATIDEFHIFDRALSAAEVQSLQDSPAGTTGGGNIAWYRCDETEGSTLLDSSPNGRGAGIVPVPNEDDQELWKPVYPGYVGAIPEDAVIRLAPPRFAVYGGNLNTNVWAPWYTQHKIMRGLLDAYYLTGNQTALDVVTKMANWAHMALTTGDKNHPQYTGPITRSDLNYMWDTYIAGELGGANEIFPEIFALTGDEQHLDTAKLFDNRESLFDAAVEDRDILVLTNPRDYGRRRPNRLHVNMHVPNFTGYLRIFEQSGEQDYFDAAKHFFTWIVPHRMFSHGGTGGDVPGFSSNIEMFQNRDNIANAIAQGGAETCSVYNVSKLGRNLFFHTQDAAYMDHYERALFNQLAGSRGDTTSVSNPQVTYFQPLTPGASKSYSQTGTCCGGTGLEIHTKYQESVYARSADGSALWVNLYVPSTLTWAEKGLVVSQETAFPRQDSTRITIQSGGGLFDLNLRVPAWVERGFTVQINGRPAPIRSAEPGTYSTIRRTWRPGDVIDISMPFSIRIERAIDRPDTQSIMWGPLLMPILGSPGAAGTYRQLSLYKDLKLDGDYSRTAITSAGRSAAGDQLFETHGLGLRPWYVGDTQRHSAYFRRVEPQIVFGSIDSGVPNVKRNDGLPKYDVPVTGIPQPGTDGLTFLDVVWDNAPFKNHGAFVSTVAKTADEFVGLGLLTEDQKDTLVSTAASQAVRAELAV